MRALLLAAGLGTRLRPITNSIPKCMVPINGQPLIGIWLESLFSNGFERVLINLHYFPDVVREYVTNSAWSDQIDCVFEPELLGTGGTLVANKDFSQGRPLLLAHADNLTDFNPADFMAFHSCRPARFVMTMMAFETDAPQTCGILELDENDVVTDFHEKVANPPGNLANAAVYVVEPEVGEFAASLGKPFVDLSTEVIPNFLGHIAAYVHSGYHRDIGNPQSYELAQQEYGEVIRLRGLLAPSVV